MTDHLATSLHAAETKFQDALRRNDVEDLDAILHDDVRFVGPDGLTIDKAADLAAHESGSLTFSAVTELRREVQVFGQLGVTRVALHLVGRAGGEPLDAELAYTRAWHREANDWIIVAAHGSVVPPSLG
jgi:ketosteroid isomerase-like protein